jgi:hypothetical protein
MAETEAPLEIQYAALSTIDASIMTPSVHGTEDELYQFRDRYIPFCLENIAHAPDWLTDPDLSQLAPDIARALGELKSINDPQLSDLADYDPATRNALMLRLMQHIGERKNTDLYVWRGQNFNPHIMNGSGSLSLPEALSFVNKDLTGNARTLPVLARVPISALIQDFRSQTATINFSQTEAFHGEMTLSMTKPDNSVESFRLPKVPDVDAYLETLREEAANKGIH